jgi:hypothetical protein
MAQNSDGTVVKRTGDVRKGSTIPTNRNPLRQPMGSDPNGSRVSGVKSKPVPRKQR